MLYPIVFSTYGSIVSASPATNNAVLSTSSVSRPAIFFVKYIIPDGWVFGEALKVKVDPLTTVTTVCPELNPVPITLIPATIVPDTLVIFNVVPVLPVWT